MSRAAPRRFERYVAIGDSSTEGLEDADGQGGYRGWADRLAAHVAAAQGSLLYANLGVRGRRTREILAEQLEPALAMRPDLATLFAGSNDAVSRSFDPAAVTSDLAEMQRRLIESGATVLSFTLPDLTPVMPIGRFVAARIARLNEILREVSAASGAILVDFANHPIVADRRFWHPDGFHASSLGHQRMAAALADALGLPGIGRSWTEPLPPDAPASGFSRLGRNVGWLFGYFLPWSWRHLWGRSSGDGRGPKRPELRPVELPPERPREPDVELAPENPVEPPFEPPPERPGEQA